MTEEKIIYSIQSEKRKEISETENPALDKEMIEVSKFKRMAIDEPPVAKKVDPLR